MVVQIQILTKVAQMHDQFCKRYIQMLERAEGACRMVFDSRGVKT